MALAPETAPERASRPEGLPSRQREFEEVALVHRERLYHLALGLCRNPPDAEDLVQETLVRAFRRFDRFTPGTNCVAWLATILRNIFINQVRRRGRIVLVADEERAAASWERRGPAIATPEDEFLMSVIDDRRLLEALHRLPRGYQEVIVLAAVEGLSHREIALRCELPIGTVMSRLFRARRLLLKAPMFGQMSAGSGGWRRRMRNGAVVGTRHREFARAAAGCGTASTSRPLLRPLPLDVKSGPRSPTSKRAAVGAWARLVPQNARALVESLSGGDPPRKRPRDVAALFVDIQGCTRLCEDLPAVEMNAVIERYFSAYLDVIRGAGGEVTEVLGDGLLALFEGSDLKKDAQAAFEVALEIEARTRRLNDRRRRRHDPITVNIGLNAGRALVGFTRLRGRSGERWVYAATGPVTNVAARLCALATGGQILTTRAVADLLAGNCDCRPLGRHSLRNVTGLVEVIEISRARNHGGRVETEGPRGQNG